MDAALELVIGEVRELIRRRGLDPARDHAALRTLTAEAISDYYERSLRGSVPQLLDVELAAKAVLDAVAGYGPLQPYLDDPDVEEIWINSPGRVFIAKQGVPDLPPVPLPAGEVRDLVERMLRPSGRRLDISAPFVDATLATGERLHVVLPGITREHLSVNIRKYVARARHIDDLVAVGSLDSAAAAFLEAAVAVGLNILVSGSTQAGKTTMLGALAGSIPASQRLITCEEVFELQTAVRDVVALQCRQPNLEGTGEVTLRRLVKEALRMRPDRLIIGEVREAESLDLLIALNAGIPGMGTIHANSARDAVNKLTVLPLLAGENVTSSFVIPTVATALDIVIHLELAASGRRRVREIVAVPGRSEGGVVETSTIYRRAQGVSTGPLIRGNGFPPGDERFAAAGYDLAKLLSASPSDRAA